MSGVRIIVSMNEVMVKEMEVCEMRVVMCGVNVIMTWC